MINRPPADYQEKKTRLEVEKQLDDILAAAQRLADSSCTRDNSRDRLIQECNNVKDALQNLMDEYMKHVRIFLVLSKHCLFIFQSFHFSFGLNMAMIRR